MFTDWAVPRRRTPICSAIEENKLLKISRRTGSRSVLIRTAPVLRSAVSSRLPEEVRCADQPASTTVVELASAMIAGPVIT